MKLTQPQVLRALERLNRGWPDELKLFVGDGKLHLYRAADLDLEESDAFSLSGANAIARFGRIRADGGGF